MNTPIVSTVAAPSLGSAVAEDPVLETRALTIKYGSNAAVKTVDLVIAANVLHATLDLDQTLSNVRR